MNLSAARWPTTTLAVTLLLLTLTACESSTDIEQPTFKNGSNADLAIELPPFFDPNSNTGRIVTEFKVVDSGQIWFRNTTEDLLELWMRVVDERHGINEIIGVLKLPAFQVEPMELNTDLTRDQLHASSWSMRYKRGPEEKTIIVGIR